MFKIQKITFNYLENPICIEHNEPLFISWSYRASADVWQKSYRLLVTKRKELLETNQCDVWDSGVVETKQMTNIEYLGPKLQSRTTYFVKLIVKGTKGESSYHESSFETTLDEKEWQGKWISIPNNFNGGTLYFRKKFELKDKKIKKARAYIIGVGYHEFYVNSEKIGNHLLNPGVTNYDKSVLYDVYDYTDKLKKGEDNVVGIEVGYGWLGSRKLLAQFYVEYEDGEIYEDHSTCNWGWWVSGTPVIENSIYGGEVYDARLEELTSPHWASPDFEPAWDNGWMYTILTQPLTGRKVAQQIAPIRHLETFKEVSRNNFSKNNIVFDVGQNLAGWARIKVQGERGASVTLVYGEGLKEDGHVNQLNLRSARCTDKYILKGDGVEEYAPRFTYHGFQYVEAIIEGNATIIELNAEFIHSDFEETGHFTTDDNIINHLHHMAKITEQNNQHSILTDCPQRDERFGWLNDLTARAYQCVYNFDMAQIFRKVLNDITETQNEEGAISDTAPYYTGGQPADVTSVSYLLMAKFAYIHYGDKYLIEKEYNNHKKWVDYLLTRQKDYIMDYFYYADWVNPTTLINSFSDGIFVSTILLQWHLQLMSEFAQITNNEEDYKVYGQHATNSKVAINKHYYDESGNYSKGTQTENAMAITLGVCAPENVDKVVANIVASIKENNNHLTCGNQGYRHVFYVLAEHGYADLALDVLRNDEYPGWGYMVAQGATTVWERWEAEMENIMHSFNHPMFGSYDGIFYHYLAGIQIKGVAASEIIIAPIVVKSLNKVEATHKSIRGEISSAWYREDNGIIRHVIKVPTNSKATLEFKNKVITINGEQTDKHTFIVPSGYYEFMTQEGEK